MKAKLLVTLVIVSISGCVTSKPVVPELAGKPRVKINNQDHIASDAEFPDVEAPTPKEEKLKDTKGSKKNVRKTNNGGNTSN